jgi:hypothetical protein
MNTLIQQLACRADDLARARVPDLRDIPVYNHVRDLEFAELIVRECANFVDYRMTNPDGASMAWCDGSDIKEHFGVEL